MSLVVGCFTARMVQARCCSLWFVGFSAVVAVMYAVDSSPTACPLLVTVETMLQYAPNSRRHTDKFFDSVAPRAKL